jgi:hypothetical protein
MRQLMATREWVLEEKTHADPRTDFTHLGTPAVARYSAGGVRIYSLLGVLVAAMGRPLMASSVEKVPETFNEALIAAHAKIAFQ